jgi:quercetin dioxygenase-like cupin family protein
VTPAKIYSIDSNATSAEEPQAAWGIFRHLAAALDSRPPPPAQHARLRGSVLARLRALGPCGTRTVRAEEGGWQALAPGVSIKLLRRGADADDMTAYVRMQPGSVLEPHVHQQAEECLVLEGEILIGTHRLSAGDMHVAEAGTVHGAIRSPRGALMLVRAQAC